MNAAETFHRTEWRRCLIKDHSRPSDVWIVTFKKDSGQPYRGCDAAVEEALH